MIIVLASVPGQPEHRAEINAALATCAAASRSDQGCQSYVFYSDVEDPDSYCSVEVWDSQADLDAHMQQPHTQALLAAIGDKVTAAPVIAVHEVVGG